MHDAEKLLARMADTKQRLAEAVKENTIGKYVIELISRDGEISVTALMAALDDAISSSPSARGKGAPEQDMARLAAAAALEYIRSLIKPSAG